MHIISREFKTSDQAEAFQLALCDQYHSVNLTHFPRFSEAGKYTWLVRGEFSAARTFDGETSFTDERI